MELGGLLDGWAFSWLKMSSGRSIGIHSRQEAHQGAQVGGTGFVQGIMRTPRGQGQTFPSFGEPRLEGETGVRWEALVARLTYSSSQQRVVACESGILQDYHSLKQNNIKILWRESSPFSLNLELFRPLVLVCSIQFAFLVLFSEKNKTASWMQKTKPPVAR